MESMQSIVVLYHTLPSLASSSKSLDQGVKNFLLLAWTWRPHSIHVLSMDV